MTGMRIINGARRKIQNTIESESKGIKNVIAAMIKRGMDQNRNRSAPYLLILYQFSSDSKDLLIRKP